MRTTVRALPRKFLPGPCPLFADKGHILVNVFGEQENTFNLFSVQCRRFFGGSGGERELVLYVVALTRTIFDSRYELRIADITWTGRRIDHTGHSFNQS